MFFKLTIITQWLPPRRHSGAVNVNFEKMLHINLLFLLLTSNIFYTFITFEKHFAHETRDLMV